MHDDAVDACMEQELHWQQLDAMHSFMPLAYYHDGISSAVAPSTQHMDVCSDRAPPRIMCPSSKLPPLPGLPIAPTPTHVLYTCDLAAVSTCLSHACHTAADNAA